MGYHHLALATRNMEAVHNFYEGVMEFELVKVEVAPSPEGGWARHFFYRMENDSRFIAFWELHDMPGVGENFETNLSRAAGLPDHINHIAFDVADRQDLERRKWQWLDAGLDVMEIDHNWCHSIYTKDPNDNLVEFCLTTGKFTATDRDFALSQLKPASGPPDFSRPPAKIQTFKAQAPGAPAGR